MSIAVHAPTKTKAPPAREGRPRAEAGTRPLDLGRDDDCVRIAVALPGLHKEDVRVEIEDGVLFVSVEGDRMPSEPLPLSLEGAREALLDRTVTLPTGVHPEDAEAEFRDGVLTLRFPKAHASPARVLPIR